MFRVNYSTYNEIMTAQKGVDKMANGFSFGGVHSNVFGLIMNKKNIPLTPPIDNRLQEISGHDGSWDYGFTYGNKVIEIDVTMFADTGVGLKAKARQLAGWLNPRNGIQSLVFDDDPDVQYFGRITNQIPLDQLGALGTFTLQFTCPDPFTYGIEERKAQFVNDLRTTHNGTIDSLPKITVTHNGGNGSITNTQPDGYVQELVFKSNSPAGVYVLDSKESTTTFNGGRGYDYVSGNYLSLPSGENFFRVSGNISKVELSFRDTWL